MDEYYYLYTRQKKQVGRRCEFEDTDVRFLGIIEEAPELASQFSTRKYQDSGTLDASEFSEHAVNTEKIRIISKGVRHVEGGWPKDVDPAERQETVKWRRRHEKDPAFVTAVKSLCTETEPYLKENQIFDIGEEYFTLDDIEERPESLTTRTVMLFRDAAPADSQRLVTDICWQPDGALRLVAAYGQARLDRAADLLPSSSYVWDMENPNSPANELVSASPCLTLKYNPKNTDLVLGGCYSGALCLWDLRKGSTPIDTTQIEKSHFDAVYSVAWLQSKTCTEGVSVATDGSVCWWDSRNFKEPVAQCNLVESKNPANPLCGICLEWAFEAGPTKFLIGSEQGSIIGLAKKPKKAVEVTQRYGEESGGHYGPVYCLRRNMAHPKYFLSVGDWSAKVWMEELKVPILDFQFHDAPLLCTEWSSGRPSVFAVGRQDGVAEFWDLCHSQSQSVYQLKVSEAELNTLSFGLQGSLVALGDGAGCVTVIKLSDHLCNSTISDRKYIGQIFEREARMAKVLSLSRRQQTSAPTEARRATLSASARRSNAISTKPAGTKGESAENNVNKHNRYLCISCRADQEKGGRNVFPWFGKLKF